MFVFKIYVSTIVITENMMWNEVHNIHLFIHSFFFFFWGGGLCWVLDATWVLDPWPGIKPMPPALGARSLNHWTTREVPTDSFFHLFKNICQIYQILIATGDRKMNTIPHPTWLCTSKRDRISSLAFGISQVCMEIVVHHLLAANHQHILTFLKP